MADRQKQQAREAIRIIRDGLKYQLEQSEKLGDTAFTISSRDFGITNPNIRKDITERQAAKGIMTAGYIVADYYLNPEKYSARALKDKASREVLKRAGDRGADYVNSLMPEPLRKELDLTIDFRGMGVEDVLEGGRPTIGAEYKRPIELFDGRARGTAGLRVKRDPRGETFVGGNVRLKFAKGGKVKQYAKGGGVRKPKLK